VPGSARLYHAALLFPSRAALGGWLQRAIENGIEFDGASDHLVSEALYFSDPDGNGLEFYADRPRDQWPEAQGQVEMATGPCDVQSLLHAGERASPPLSGAGWGHLHLRVIDLGKSEAFYASELGMKVTQRSYPGARFLAADGYHHHLGLNSWGSPRSPHSPHALGLVDATFCRRDLPGPVILRDPNGIVIRVEPLR
jgi:catechol 2,3-dioxygenase